MVFENVLSQWGKGEVFGEKETERQLVPVLVEEDFKRPVKCWFLDEDGNILNVEPETIFNVHSYWESHLTTINFFLAMLTLFLLLLLVRFLLG